MRVALVAFGNITEKGEMYKTGSGMRGQGPRWLGAGAVGKGRAEQRLVKNSRNFS